jgi:hypothetical protein
MLQSIYKPTIKGKTKMTIMYQNEKQRLVSEDIERRFPTISDPDIASVYYETLKHPEPSRYYENTYAKNKYVMRNIKFNDNDISDYLRDVTRLEERNKVRKLPTKNRPVLKLRFSSNSENKKAA